MLHRSTWRYKTLLIQFLWVRLRRSQRLVCRASICSMNAVLEGSNLDLFQVKHQQKFCRGNCAANQAPCSANWLLDFAGPELVMGVTIKNTIISEVMSFPSNQHEAPPASRCAYCILCGSVRDHEEGGISSSITSGNFCWITQHQIPEDVSYTYYFS
jgi:hypothetical protein